MRESTVAQTLTVLLAMLLPSVPAIGATAGIPPPGPTAATSVTRAEPDTPIKLTITLGLRDRADVQAAKDFLVAQGFEKITQPTPTTVEAVGTIAIVERALQVQIDKNVDQGRAVFATDRDPVLPQNLAPIISKDIRLSSVGNPLTHIVAMTDPNAPESVTTAANLLYYGGPVVSHAKTVQVLYGAGAYGAGVAAGGSTHVTKLGDFYAAVTNHPYMDWLCEYNTNITAQNGGPGTNQTIGRGSFVGTYTITPDPTHNGATITDSQIHAELSAQITAGNLPAPDADTIYMINFPSGKTITGPGGTSCVQFCGYHGTYVRSSQNVYYAVFPEFVGSNCANGCGADANLFNDLTSVASHELIETVTDAAVGLATVLDAPLAWYDPICDSQGCPGHAEIGDICNAQQSSIVGSDSVTYTVQKEWSNASAACIAQKPDTAPVALCHDVTVFANACSAAASIDNGSSDPDCWDTLQKTQFPPGPYAASTTTPVTMTVTDGAGQFATCSANVTVVSTGCDDQNVCTANDTCQSAAPVQQNFDGVAAPALPAGWVSTVTAGTNPWTTSAAFSVSAPNAATTDTPEFISDKTLDTPAFVAGVGSFLEFDNQFNLETVFDGAVIEIKIGAGPFTDIIAAGGSFVSGGYNWTISTLYSSPIAGRAAWSGASAGFVHTKINLPAAAVGQTVILRFRVASDVSVAAAPPNGQWLDNVVITNPAVCQGTQVSCDDSNVCTDDSCSPATGCVHANNGGGCNDGNACTVGDTCRGGLCGGGTSAPVEQLGNNGFETGIGVITCGPNGFQRDVWTGTGSAIQYSACPWTPSGVVASIGFPGGNAPGTISQTFPATPGPGTLSYQHGTDAPAPCSYTVTFGPSNTVVPVNVQLPAGLIAAATIAVPAGTTSVTFGNPSCVNGINDLLQFDNVSLTAGVATVLGCDDSNVCTDDSCTPVSGCVHTTVPGPGETQNVVVAANKTTYTWSTVAGATRYDVVRGSTGAFPVGPGGGDETCFDNLPGASLVDAASPALGSGFWYLSRGESACANGTFGTQGVHGAPGAPRVTSTCP